MTQKNYDLVIIGGGPAGLTAGIYAARARLNVLLVEKMAPGGQIFITDWIENYPGFPEGINGAELAMKMADQAKHFDVAVQTDEVLSLDLKGPQKKIVLNSAEITSKAIIIATGAAPKRLGIPGEERFYGKGVSFCATCDGPFFKDQIVVAVGGGDTAVQESIYLTKFAKKVYLVHRRDKLRATKIIQERALANDKIEILWDTIPKRIDGDINLSQITLENVKTKAETTLPAEGCFIWIGIHPNTNFLKDTIHLNASGFIPTDAHMATNVPGVFAAGDVRDTPLRQVVTAVSDGAIAVHSALHYIENL